MHTNPNPNPNPTRSRRGRRRLLGGLVAGALVVAACGGADETSVAVAGADTEPEVAAATDGAVAAPAAPAGVADVLVGTTPLGEVLIGPDGRTLYGFTNDVQAASTCYGTCAEAWPPVIVSDDWTAGPGLDFGIFATTVRDDGTRQLVAGAWPLYYFAGDAVAGDVNGQGSGNVWFAVDLDGGLIEGDAAAAEGAEAEAATASTSDVVAEADSDLGTILVDEAGLSLYGFLDDRDADGPTCNDACADAWPPVIVSGTEVPAGLDPEVFSVVTRDDGRNQLQAGIWPLYRFAGDGAPGDINGQGSGEVWFLAAPDGSLIGVGGAPAEAGDTTEDSAAETESDSYDY